MTTPTCIIVNERDEAIQIAAVDDCQRRPGTLRRSFSVMVVDAVGAICMQQRAACKTTFPLYWSNAVCSHPRDETIPILGWVKRRCMDELGLDLTHDSVDSVELVHRVHFRAPSGVEWVEHGMDHVFEVRLTERPRLRVNPDEIRKVEWIKPQELRSWLVDDARCVSPWFRAIWRLCYDPETGARRTDMDQHGITAAMDFDAVSHANLASDHAHLTPFSYICGIEGKRIRPLMADALVELTALSQADADRIASTVQRIHNATLVADDIEDASATRRGARCAHHVFGTPLAINAPYFAIFKVLQGLSQEPLAVTHLTIEALVDLHRGQGSDIQWGEQGYCPTVEEYLRMISGKTGALFRLIARLGAAYSPNHQSDEITSIYSRLAQYFQIRDDYCNICDPAYWERKGFFEDLDEGKMSYSVIHYLRHSDKATPTGRATLRFLLGKTSPSHAEKEQAYRLLFEGGSLRYTAALLVSMRSELATRVSGSKILTSVLDRLNLVDPPLL